MFFQFRSRSTRASHPLHCPLPLLVSIIWLSLPRIISWVGSAAFWRKCQRQTSGCCTQRCVEPPASSSSSPAGSLVISWRQVILPVAYSGDQARRALKLVLSFPGKRQKLLADDLSVLHCVNADF